MFRPYKSELNSFVPVIVQLQDAAAQTSLFWHVAKSCVCFANTTLKGFV